LTETEDFNFELEEHCFYRVRTELRDERETVLSAIE